MSETEGLNKKVREKILKQYKKELDEMIAEAEALTMKINAFTGVVAEMEKLVNDAAKKE